MSNRSEERRAPASAGGGKVIRRWRPNLPTTECSAPKRIRCTPDVHGCRVEVSGAGLVVDQSPEGASDVLRNTISKSLTASCTQKTKPTRRITWTGRGSPSRTRALEEAGCDMSRTEPAPNGRVGHCVHLGTRRSYEDTSVNGLVVRGSSRPITSWSWNEPKPAAPYLALFW